MKLSIVIPTYNRARKVAARVRELLPQLTPECELVIIDNCSSPIVEDVVLSEVPESAGRIRHVKNRANIGANANICRCFEFASGQWLWLLGDDDVVRDNAVDGILQQLADVDGNVGYVNFSTSIFAHRSSRVVSNLSGFIEGWDYGLVVSNLMFISSGCYRLEMALPHLRMAYQMTYSCAPQIAMIASILAQDTIVGVMSEWHLVDREPCDPNEAWSYLQVISGFPALLDLNGVDPAVSRIVERIILDIRWRPFIGAGIHYIFNDNGRSIKFWRLLLVKIFICSGYRMKARASVLLFLLPMAAFKPTRSMVRRMINHWVAADANQGSDRL